MLQPSRAVYRELTALWQQAVRDPTSLSGVVAAVYGRVKHYFFGKQLRDGIWVVVGKEKEYVVEPDEGICTCPDSFFRVLSGEKCYCYHLHAVKVAWVLGSFQVVVEQENRLVMCLLEWLT